jgi:hypothetical protein
MVLVTVWRLIDLICVPSLKFSVTKLFYNLHF